MKTAGSEIVSLLKKEKALVSEIIFYHPHKHTLLQEFPPSVFQNWKRTNFLEQPIFEINLVGMKCLKKHVSDMLPTSSFILRLLFGVRSLFNFPP